VHDAELHEVPDVLDGVELSDDDERDLVRIAPGRRARAPDPVTHRRQVAGYLLASGHAWQATRRPSATRDRRRASAPSRRSFGSLAGESPLGPVRSGTPSRSSEGRGLIVVGPRSLRIAASTCRVASVVVGAALVTCGGPALAICGGPALVTGGGPAVVTGGTVAVHL